MVTNVLLYAAVVLIWGSTWIMVRFQIGVVPAEISVAYRMGIAALIMFGWNLASGEGGRFRLKEHLWIALQGALIFSTNFFLFYLAAAHLTTGLISVVFSSAAIMTMMLRSAQALIWPQPRMMMGAILGIIGMAAVFWPQVSGLADHPGAGMGLLLSIGGTACFSLGSLVSARNQSVGLKGPGCMAWAMFYGTALLGLYAWIGGHGMAFDPAFAYVGSLLYLSLLGSVAAFAAYFALLRRIEAERAAYATVMFPIVALLLSTLFEGYQWRITALLGVLLTMTGNVLVLKPQARK